MHYCIRNVNEAESSSSHRPTLLNASVFVGLVTIRRWLVARTDKSDGLPQSSPVPQPAVQHTNEMTANSKVGAE